MYTEIGKKAVASIIKQIANAHQKSEAQVRYEMEEAMDAGQKNSDPAVQALWEAFDCSSEGHTLEEFILWAATMTILR